jgi:hypothetical protein
MATYFLQNLKYQTLLPLLVGMSLILGGCQNLKVSDCNQLNEVTNSGKSLPVAKNSDEFMQLSQSLGQLNLKIQAIALQDQNLNTYKNEFSQLYEAMAQASSQISQAATNSDRNLLIQSQQSLKTLNQQELSLVAAVNKYCIGN